MDKIIEILTDAGPAVIIGQTLGIVGMLLAMISFQYKKNTVYCTFQTFSGLAFTIHFFILGYTVQGGLNMFNILRGWAFGFAPEKSRKFFLVLLFILYSGATVVTYTPEEKLWVSLMILCAQLLGTVVMYIHNAKVIRIAQLAYTSPAWMISNVMTKSVGGVLCETFNIISSIVALIRFRKEWFPKKSNAPVKEEQ